MPLSRNTTKRVKHKQRERESLLEQFIVAEVGARVWPMSFVFLVAPYFLMREQTKRERTKNAKERK